MHPAVPFAIIIALVLSGIDACASPALRPANPQAASPSLTISLTSPAATTSPSPSPTHTTLAVRQTSSSTKQPASTETGMPLTPTHPAVTPTVVFAQHFDHVWDRDPEIVVVTKEQDPRIDEVNQAVLFWNEQLKAMGTPFRLGTVIESYNYDPDDLVPAQYRNPDSSGDPGPVAFELPKTLASLPGDIIVALTDIDLTSRNMFTKANGQTVKNGRDLILIRHFPANITTQNQTGAIIHELGHAVGLSHDNYPLSVMCGPPWMDTCRQRLIVLDQDQKYILSIYPVTWTPTK